MATQTGSYDFKAARAAAETSKVTRSASGQRSFVTTDAADLPLLTLSPVLGESVQDGTPTPTSPVYIQAVRPRNILNPSKFKATSTVTNGITVTNNGDGTFTLNGTASATCDVYLTESFYTPAETGVCGTWTLSGLPSNNGAAYTDLRLTGRFKSASASNVYLNDYGLGSTYTFSSGYYLEVLYVNVPSGKVLTNLVVKPQLEYGSTAHEYVPYGNLAIVSELDGSTLDVTYINLKGYELHGLDSAYRDTLDIDASGHAVITKRVGHMHVTEVTGINDGVANFQIEDGKLNVLPSVCICLCDKLSLGQYDVATFKTKINVVKTVRNSSSNTVMVGNIRFDGTETTVAAFNSTLASIGGLDLYYELEEPYTVDLGYVSLPEVTDDSTVHVEAEVQPVIGGSWWTKAGETAGKAHADTRDNFQAQLDPLASRTYTGLYGSANDAAGASFYFAKVHPAVYEAPWRVSLRIRITAPVTYTQSIDIEIRGDNSSFRSYNAMVNRDTNLAMYCINLYRAKSAGITNGKGHALGFGLRASTNPTSSSYPRTISVDVLEAEGCDVELIDAVKYADMDGTGSTNYDGLTELPVNTNGQNATNNGNTTYSKFLSAPVAGLNGMKPYTLCMQDANGLWTSIVNENSTGTSKTRCTYGLKLGNVTYYSHNSSIAAGSNANDGLWESYTLDFRYSANINTSGLVTRKPVYLVGTMGNDGLFYLASTWWATALPTSADGKVYIYVGDAYSGYQIFLHVNNPAYVYHDGEIKTYEQYQADEAAKVAGNYIVETATNDVWVHSENHGPNSSGVATADTYGWRIGSVFELVRAGLSYFKMWVENSVAKVRVGLESAGHSVFSPDGMEVFMDSTTSVARFGDTVRVGKSASTNVSILPTRMELDTATATAPVRFSVGLSNDGATGIAEVTVVDMLGQGAVISGTSYYVVHLENQPSSLVSVTVDDTVDALQSASVKNVQGSYIVCIPESSYSQYSGKRIEVVYETSDPVTSLAYGTSCAANGNDSAALGYNSKAYGRHSLAAGGHCKAYGDGSVAFGSYSAASGDCSVAMGEGCETAEGAEASIAAGIESTASGIGSFAFGDGLQADGNFVVGSFNADTQSIFVVGNGEDDGNRSNAFTVDADGDVTCAGKLTAANVGAKQSDESSSSTSLSNGTTKAVASVSLAAGTWVVVGHAVFASNSSGVRSLGIGSTANSLSYTDLSCVTVRPASGADTRLQSTSVVSPTSTTTYYLNAYQNSGSSMNCTSAKLTAIRIK